MSLHPSHITGGVEQYISRIRSSELHSEFEVRKRDECPQGWAAVQSFWLMGVSYGGRSVNWIIERLPQFPATYEQVLLGHWARFVVPESFSTDPLPVLEKLIRHFIWGVRQPLSPVKTDKSKRRHRLEVTVVVHSADRHPFVESHYRSIVITISCLNSFVDCWLCLTTSLESVLHCCLEG